MPYITVILRNGTKVFVADADSADWMSEPAHRGSSGIAPSVTRLVCRRGTDTVLGRFDADQIAGYTWHDGHVPGTI